LFSIWSGALNDRYDSKRIIQFGMVLFMLCSFGWGVLFATDTLQVWHAVVLLTIHGMAGVFWAPASQMLIHDIAGRDNLHSAVRLMAMARTLGLLGGPAVGGAMLLAFGPSLGMLINVLIYVPLTWWLWKAPYGSNVGQERRAAPRQEGGFAGVWATAREIAGNHIVVSMTLLAAATSFVLGNAYQAQMPEFAADFGHDHADFHYSMLFGANAAGALAAGLILETYGLLQARPKAAIVLVILWALCLGGFAVSTVFALSVALLVAAGFLNLAFGAMTQTLVQLHAPNHLRGRVLGLYNMCYHGMRAFSGVFVGMGGSLIGVHWALALSAALMLVVAFGLLAFELRPRMPEPAE
jgi:MFS family permease